MLRLAFSRRIPVLLGIAAVAAVVVAAVCFGDGASDGTRETADLTPPPPAADAQVKEILFADKAIAAMVAGREERRDYWIDVSHVGPRHGDRIAWIQIVFAEPVFYAGEILFGSDPCQGHSGEDERLDPDDPCLDEPREYGTRYVTFSGVRDIFATVEVGRRQVVNIWATDTPDDIVDDTIEYFKSKQGQ